MRREHLVIVTMWLLGLASIVAVLVLQGRLDQRRQAQLAVSNLRLEVNALPRLALGLNGPFTRAYVQTQLDAAERGLVATAKTLDGPAGNGTDSQLIISEARPVFARLARANTVASSGQLRAATVTLALSLLPGQPGYRLNSTFSSISAKYDRQASSARRLADIGTVAAILVLLLAFSAALWRATRLAHEKNELLEQSRQDALTDQLTGLWNRRKLFADIEELREGARSAPAVLGILDLDGFKAYNDHFGHPAGDALLSLFAQRLRTALAGAGEAYRMGGDEFCAIVRGADAEVVLERARAALVERSDGIAVTCSLGCAPIVPGGPTADEMVRTADQRLYDEKRAARPDEAASPVFAA